MTQNEVSSTKSKALAALQPSPLTWRRVGMLPFLLLAVILGVLVYAPVRHFEFLNLDDNLFVSNNPWLRHGLTWHSIEWAFLANLTEFSNRAEYWEPITLLSRLFDAQCFGMDAGAFHVSSAIIHLLNSVLLAFALYQLTGRWERSAVVALLFLVHPLNIQPVCWMAARKDLLSGTFFFVTLLAYAHFVRRPGLPRYLLLLAAFGAALMAKPMGVSIPLVLLALDWWPLDRWARAWGKPQECVRLVAEKVPLLLFAIGASVLAVTSQADAGAFGKFTASSFPARLRYARVSYVTYRRAVSWASDLAIIYPHPGASLPLWWIVISTLILVAITLGAVALARRRPYVLAGWFWFGIVLGPVIGLVQIGYQAMGDRYMYPAIQGILIIVVWGVADLLQERVRLAGLAAVGAVALLTICAMQQVQAYRTSVDVFSQAIKVTHDSLIAYLNLGGAWHERGNLAEARRCFRESVRIEPRAPSLWMNLGNVEADLGNTKEAMDDYNWSISLHPTYAPSYIAMGRLQARESKTDEAITDFTRAIQLDPAPVEPYQMLRAIFVEQGRNAEAEAVRQALIKVHPEMAR